jgi:Family of unknown function (DUF5678)
MARGTRIVEGAHGMPTSEIVAEPVFNAAVVAEHGGKWVAIRGGEIVVGAADTLEELLSMPGVERSDALYRVPAGGSCFY